MTPLPTEILTGLSCGLFLGLIFGPIRLAGVDYSKWYRDPAEISEGNDWTGIGMMKRVALTTAKILLGLMLLGAAYAIRQFDLSVLHALAILLGLAVGVSIVQAALEVLWRIGLRMGTGRSLEIRLGRRVTATHLLRVPPKAGRRRLIVCCDGTWNSPVQQRETNVVQLLRAIQPEGTVAGAPVTQIAYYHLGVGTGNVLDRILGGGTGVGLSSSVKACYGFLVDNYLPGDEILLFGFSRGAFVVRSMAGMIALVGLLQKHEMFRFTDAWNCYACSPRQRDPAVLDAIAPARHQDVPINCIGVWDTVGALGVPGTQLCASAYAFHHTSLSSTVRHAFQALAIDERRGNFQPAVWVKSDRTQVLEQVWFAGVHSNIGGGYREHGLSDTTLLWMISRLLAHDVLDLDTTQIDQAIGRFHAEPVPTGRLQDSRTRGWKIIACPIPRPVGITDESEMIHQTAILRMGAAGPGDAYTNPRRQQWLKTIPASKIRPIGAFETNHSFPGPGTGLQVAPIPPPNRGLCDRLLRRLFEGA